MGSVATARVASDDAVVVDVPATVQHELSREVDVDDVRLLLKELRLRRQLRATQG
jgi:hypothetical protein